jgi:hypothetical protein
MKLSYKTSNIQQFILFIIANLALVSCGTYQSAYNNDGIYNSDVNLQRENTVVIADEKEYENYNNSYFTNELERLDNLNNGTIFTDVDAYNSPDSLYLEDDLKYNTNPSWGSTDNNDVVVHVNLMNNPYGNDFGFGYNNFGWNNNRFNNRGFNNWGSGARWGFNNGFNNWGYNPFWNPYQNNFAFGMGFNNGFYNPYYGAFVNPYGFNRFSNNNYYRNTRNRRRATYNNTFRRGHINSINSSITSRRRASTVNMTPKRRASSSTRRGSSNTSRKTNSTRRSVSNSQNSSIRRNSSTRRGTSNTKGNSSSTGRRSSANRSSSNTSRRKSTPSRNSSSTRSSSGRNSSSRGSSSRRSRSSRGSSSSKRGNN